MLGTLDLYAIRAMPGEVLIGVSLASFSAHVTKGSMMNT